MSTRALVVAFSVLALAGAVIPSNGDPIVDVAYLPPLNNHGTVQGDNQFAQTFVPGLSGAMTGLDLPIAREFLPLAVGDVVISILPTVGGDPVSDLGLALATVLLPATHWGTTNIASDIDAYRHVEFASPFLVQAGDMLAIVVRHAPTTVPDTLYWYGGSGVLYSGGQSYERIGSEAEWTPVPWLDFAFVSYVDPDAATVPEPASLLLLGTGLAVAGFVRRRLKGPR